MRTILKNEFTWLISIVLAIFGFVNTVVLPLQKVQLQLTELQQDIIDEKAIIVELIKDHDEYSSRLDVLETTLGMPKIK